MKQNLINNIIQEMLHYLNNSQIMRLKQILEYHLFNYDLIQKVNNYEKKKQNLLKIFLDAKRVEGCS